MISRRSGLSPMWWRTPYDVIDAVLQERLYQASSYNAIRLELNRAETSGF